MARKRRTRKELATASDQLHAEVRMLTVLVNGIIVPQEAPAPVVAQAMVSTFLKHALTVIHFLHPVRPRAGDVLAEDYFSEPAAWDRVRLRQSERLTLARKRAEGEYGRLAYGRPAALPVVDPRHVLEIANEISAGLSIFLSHVPKENLGETWGKFVGSG